MKGYNIEVDTKDVCLQSQILLKHGEACGSLQSPVLHSISKLTRPVLCLMLACQVHGPLAGLPSPGLLRGSSPAHDTAATSAAKQ